MKKQKQKLAVENLECLIFGLNIRSKPELALTYDLLTHVLGTLIDDLESKVYEARN